jgi:hypothetical protein
MSLQAMDRFVARRKGARSRQGLQAQATGTEVGVQVAIRECGDESMIDAIIERE